MSSGNLKAGAAVANITPPLGCVMAGYGNRDQYADDVDDELFAKALVVSDGLTEVAIVTTDLINMSSDVTGRVASLVRERVGIPEECLLVTASHTHFGPLVDKVDFFSSPDISGKPDPAWLDILVKRLAGVVVLAHKRLQDARIGFGAAEAGPIAYNRRTKKPDGKVTMSWLLPEDTSGLEFGPTDTEVGILKVEDTEGKPIATLLNFACHAVCGCENLYAISADYPGQAMRLLEATTGAPCLFTLGAAGNIVPLVRRGDARRRIGGTVGAAAISKLAFIETAGKAGTRTAAATVELPLKTLGRPEDLQRKLDELEGQAGEKQGEARTLDPGASAGNEIGRVRQELATAKKYAGQKTYSAKMHAVELGGAAIITAPGEIFVETGLAVKKAGRGRPVMFISLCGDAPDYIPTRQAYEEGGYEPEWTIFAPGAAEILRDEAIRLLDKLRKT